jgi:hypothetical protein
MGRAGNAGKRNSQQSHESKGHQGFKKYGGQLMKRDNAKLYVTGIIRAANIIKTDAKQKHENYSLAQQAENIKAMAENLKRLLDEM